MKAKKVICIDARLWGGKHTGIGRYIENLIDNLVKSSKYEFVLIVPPSLKSEPKLDSFTKYYARFHPYSLFSQFEMLYLLIIIRPDLVHIPHFTIPVLWPGKIVVTIHDLIKHFSKGSETTTRQKHTYWLKYFGYLLIVRLAVLRANHIIVPAYYWKKIIAQKFKLTTSKISVTYEGVTELYLQQKPNRDYDPPIAKPYIVYTGNLYPHKNLPTLFKAIKLLNGKVNLAIVCARSVFTERAEKYIQREKVSRYVKFLGYVPDKELISLYSQSEALVQPSLIEGFGLTGLEAMAVKTPVIAANASCLPEVYQNAALFFEPLDSNDLYKKILLLLENNKKRINLVKKGKKLIKKFSWRKMAKQTVNIYLKTIQE